MLTFLKDVVLGSGLAGGSSYTFIAGICARLTLVNGGRHEDAFDSGTGVDASTPDLFANVSIVGTTGSVTAFDKGRGPRVAWFRGRGVASGAAEISSLSSISLGLQSFLNDTMGRPGLSDTMVGVGSLALLSFNLKPVAARSSSLRTSLPSFIFTSGSFSTSDLLSSLILSGVELFVYPAFRDCEGGFL